MSPRTLQVIPILRIFSVEKACEFYLDYAGFHLDWKPRFEHTPPLSIVREGCEFYLDSAGFHLAWKHRFEPTAPLYMQVSRDGLVLHLSEHYGDGSPGPRFQVDFEGVHELHAELSAKNYPYWRP